jgi:ferric-dicitrate binding protein FerR (iron transport regulator)
MAAAILVLLAASIWYFKPTNEVATPSVIAAGNVEKKEVLSDGTTTDLKPTSTLTTAFSKHERRVKLEGEAFFKVAPNKEKPFIIEVKTLEIKVVGTQFNVDNLSEKDKIIVTVTEGIVQLRGGEKTIELTKDMQAVFNTTNNTFEAVKKPEQTEILPSLNFDSDVKTLREVVKVLEKYFKKEIKITSTEVGQCLVNQDFTNKDLNLILEVLQETCEFSYEKTEKGYILKQ